MKTPVGMLWNTVTGRYHPLPFRLAPLPGEGDLTTGLHQFRSMGHHIEGFDTIEAALSHIAEHESWICINLAWPWNGTDSPLTFETFDVTKLESESVDLNQCGRENTMCTEKTQMGSRWVETSILRFGEDLGEAVMRSWSVVAERAASHPISIRWNAETGEVRHHVDERTGPADWERWLHKIESRASELVAKHPGEPEAALAVRLEDEAREGRLGGTPGIRWPRLGRIGWLELVAS